MEFVFTFLVGYLFLYLLHTGCLTEPRGACMYVHFYYFADCVICLVLLQTPRWVSVPEQRAPLKLSSRSRTATDAAVNDGSEVIAMATSQMGQ